MRRHEVKRRRGTIACARYGPISSAFRAGLNNLATVRPRDQWIAGRIPLRFCEPVKMLLRTAGVVTDGDEARRWKTASTGCVSERGSAILSACCWRVVPCAPTAATESGSDGVSRCCDDEHQYSDSPFHSATPRSADEQDPQSTPRGPKQSASLSGEGALHLLEF